MALITKEVTVRWYYKTKEYYIDKGYVFTKLGDEFIVKAEDIYENSSIVVDIQCDYCGEIKPTKFCIHHNAINSEIPKDSCKQCWTIKTKETMELRYGNNYKDKFGSPSIQKFTFDFVKDEFEKRGYKLLTTSYIGQHQKLRFVCDIHGEKSISFKEFRKGRGCQECGKEIGRQKLSGENNYNWKGGNRDIKLYLRDKLIGWQWASKVSCHFKCVICGDKMDRVHHLYGFSTIFYETFELLNITLRPNRNNYSDDELDLLSAKIQELHDKYGLGACLCESHHALFHSQYGFGDNTPEQFEKFKASQKVGDKS